jgi:hypothetical protein
VLPAVRGAVALALLPGMLSAQEKLVGASTATTGAVFESWSLPTSIAVTTPAGSVLVSGASQLTVPLAVVAPLAPGWTVDVYSAYVRGRVRVQSADGTTRTSYALDGVTDTKLRLVGQLAGDALLLTVGVTAPSGRTQLNDEQLAALGVLAAPALRLRSPVLGAGAGATLGLIFSHQVAGWGLALGTSYEARGTYAPTEALQAGVATSDLRPGNGVHASFAAERTAGAVRHMMSVAADVYQDGELRNQTGVDRSKLTLGPSFTGSYELDATVGAYESALFVVGRRRTEIRLGGETIPGSARTEVEGGLQTFRALSPARALRLALEGRVHSTSHGLDSAGDPSAGTTLGFSTAGAAIGGGTVAFRFGGAPGGWALEPFVRGQVGRLDFESTTRTVTGVSGGVTLSASF